MYIMPSSRKASAAYALVTIVSLILLWPAIVQSAPPTTKEELLKRVHDAVEARDVEAMLALYRWEGVPEFIEKMTRRNEANNVKNLADAKVDKIDFAPLPDDFQNERIRKGFRYRINVNPVGSIEVKYSNANVTSGSFGWFYGTVEDNFYLASYTEEKLENSGPPDEHYNVIMTANPGTSFEGYCNFTTSGVEQTKKDSGEGSHSLTIFAQKLKFCQITRVLGDGGISLIVNKILSSDPLKYEVVFDQETCSFSEKTCALKTLEYHAPGD